MNVKLTMIAPTISIAKTKNAEIHVIVSYAVTEQYAKQKLTKPHVTVLLECRAIL